MPRPIFASLILCALLTGAAAEETAFPAQSDKPARKQSPARSVILRIYDSLPENPASFSGITGSLRDHVIHIDPAEMRKKGVVVLAMEDQDRDLPGYAPDAFYVWRSEAALDRLASTGEIEFPDFRQAASRTYDEYFLLDALSRPFPPTSVKIELVDYSTAASAFLIEIDPRPLDESGRLRLPYVVSDQMFAVRTLLTISHPDYGTARAEVGPVGGSLARLPLVRADSPAASRAAVGQVVDSEGQPLKGAEITCRSIRTLGQGLIQPGNGAVLTGPDGRFRYYASHDAGGDGSGEFVPPGSKYDIKIAPSRSLKLIPIVESFVVGEEKTCTLRPGERPHTLVFLGNDGNPLSAADAASISIQIQSRNMLLPLTMKPAELLSGGFPNGRYLATRFDSRGYPVAFLPVDVGPDSPSELIFRLPAEGRYAGRVVNGLTGTPMAGAFVFTLNSRSKANLAALTEPQWAALRELPVQLSGEEPPLAAVGEHFGFNSITRTGPDGSYVLTSSPGVESYSIMAFDKDFIPCSHQPSGRKTDLADSPAIPDLPLYPAGKVRLSLRAPPQGGGNGNGSGGDGSISPHWNFEGLPNSCWAAALDEWGNNQKARAFQYHYGPWIPWGDQPTLIFVPAGCELRLKLTSSYNDNLAPRLIPRIITARQGEILDLGVQKLEATWSIALLVTDEAGNPVEGVPVRALLEKNSWSVVHNTDASGRAWFKIAAHSPSMLAVNDFIQPMARDEEEKLKVPVQVTGEEAEPPVFRLALSADALNHIFRKPR